MNKTAKIAIIIAVIALVVLMFFLKNGFGPEKGTETAAVTEGATPTEEVSAETRMPMTQETFDMEKWLEPGLPLLVDFGSKTCGPCQRMKPDLTAFYEEMEGKMTVVYLDVWEDPARTGGLPASVVPTQFFFNADGTPYLPSDEVMQALYGFQQYTVKGSKEIVLTSHQGILMLDGLRMVAEDMGVTL